MRRSPLLLLAAAGLAVAPGSPRAEELLLGKVTARAILAVSPDWERERSAYVPAPEDVKVLAALPGRARLDVFFGSWCGDSRREVPRLLRILEVASADGLKVRFYGLDRSKKEPARLVRGRVIERVPTFILSAGGREVGRIVETPRTTLEHDLALLVERIPASP